MKRKHKVPTQKQEANKSVGPNSLESGIVGTQISI